MTSVDGGYCFVMTIDIRSLLAAALGTPLATMAFLAAYQLLRAYRKRYPTEGLQALRETVQGTFTTAPGVLLHLTVACFVIYAGIELYRAYRPRSHGRLSRTMAGRALLLASGSAVVGVANQLKFFSAEPYPSEAIDILITTALTWGVCGLLASVSVQWLLRRRTA